MKKLIVMASALLSLCAEAQMKEGRIVYERVVQLPVRVFGLDPSVAAQIPKSRTDQYELLFGNNQSLYQFLPTAANDGEGGTFSNGNIVLRMPGGNGDVSYFNLDKGTRTDHRELMERSYVVTDSITKQNWKLSEETKTVLNYTCRKATTTRISTRMQMSMENGEMKRTPIQDTATVVAWFTTDIPVSVGPEFQGQLPGAILELDVANGQSVYHAIEVSPKVSLNKIKEPKDGKKMTAAEFTKEREKLMAEMQKNMGPGMQFRMQQ